jgi:hypothetical protein
MPGNAHKQKQPTMSRRDRLRRVVLLCRDFARNLAYYRSGQSSRPKSLLDPATSSEANFWRVANSNFIDICVLDWCKLFAEKSGKHCWINVVNDAEDFQTALLKHLGVTAEEWQRQIDVMRRYRDKFLAHLDSDHVMNIPRLDLARDAVWFYHSWVVAKEAKAGDIKGLPNELDTGFQQAQSESERVFEAHLR